MKEMSKNIFKLVLLVAIAVLPACSQTPEENPASDVSTTNEAAVTEAVVPEEKRFTIEIYDKITLGITYEEAVELIGSEGEVFTESGEGEFATTVYQWKNSDSSNLQLMFQTGVLITKNQTDLVAAPDVELTKEKYQSLEFGADYASAVAVMGTEGVEVSSDSIAGQPERTEYQWAKSFDEQITITMQNGSLIGRSQSGVVTSEGADISEEKYEQITNGMSYEAMVELFGGEGIEESKTVIPNITTTASYVWAKDDPFTRISVVFQDGQPISKNYAGPE